MLCFYVVSGQKRRREKPKKPALDGRSPDSPGSAFVTVFIVYAFSLADNGHITELE